MKKKILLVIIIIIFILILLSIIFKNIIINNTNELLNNSIDNVYNYISKYNFKNQGDITVTANYKGAHGSTNPINFNYNFNVNYNDNKVYTTIENDEGYYTNNFNNDFLDLLLMIKNNEQFKNIFEIKSIKYEFNKIIYVFNENNINNIFNKNINDFKLIINTNIFYLGVNNYKLIIDNNEYIISNKFDKISNSSFDLKITNKGYNLKYKNKLKVNAILNEDMDKYNISINGIVFYVEIQDDNNIIININKEINIYKGFDLKIEFKNIDLNMQKELDEKNFPIINYLYNLNLNIGDKS